MKVLQKHFYQSILLQARQAGDVASQGSSAAVKDEYMSDSSVSAIWLLGAVI